MMRAKRWLTLILGAASFVIATGCSADSVNGIEETDATGSAPVEALTLSSGSVRMVTNASFCEHVGHSPPCENGLSGGCYNFGSALYRKVSSVGISGDSVTLYDDPTCQGNSITLNRHYGNLHEIGWGDRAASYKLN